MKKSSKDDFCNRFSVEEVAGSDSEDIENLVGLEERCCPMEMRNADSNGYFSCALKDPKRIALVLKFGNKPVGFMLAREYAKMYDDLCNHDPELEKCKKGFFYIENVQISPRYRKQAGGLELLVSKLLEQGSKRKAKGFCAYARNKDGLSLLLTKYLKGTISRSIDNWLGFQERFDYLEVEL